MGIVSPLGYSVDEFWDKLVACKSGITPLTLFDPTLFDTKFAGQCADFNPEQWIDPKAVKRLDRFAQFALVSAIQAARDSGLDFDKEDRFRVGAIVGSGIGGIGELQSQTYRLREKGPSKVSAFTIPKLMVNAASGNITIHFGLHGPSTAVATACPARPTP